MREDSARASGDQQLRARLAALEAIVAALPSRFVAPPPRATMQLVRQTSHGFSVGNAIRHNGTTWVKAQADTAANAVFGGLVIAVPHANSFVVAFPGSYVRGLSVTAGINYLSAATAGALTATAPTLAVPVLMADSTSTGVIMAGASGGGVPAAAGDGYVYATKSSDYTGEWTKTLDLGTGQRTATATVGSLDTAISTDGDAVLISDAADGIEIYDRSVSASTPLIKISLGHASLNATARQLAVREIDVCDGATAKKMLVIGSAPY